ncbi:aminopeptidase N [Actinobacillus equuli]|nr:aminopeptidase N [Actinobacillus equuli]
MNNYYITQFAQNDFVRWDAAQTLFNNELRTNLSRHQSGEALAFSADLTEALIYVLDNADKNAELTALMLTLPKETEFAELFKVIDPNGIAIVREFMLRTIAEILRDRLHEIYIRHKCGAYQVVAEDMSKRALRNVCLSYLAFTDLGNSLTYNHYKQADNMTDTLAALSAATKAQLPCRDQLLADFEEKWHHDGLVMDKWFMLQATRPDDNVLEIVQGLLNHRSFNFNNPNRLRSLVGAFCGQTPKAFHAIDGSGYRFLVDILIKLNETNPQVAARLIEPLIKLSRYDNQRQTLMRRGLERLKGLDNLARDLLRK